MAAESVAKQQQLKQPGHESGETLMAHGSHALYEYVASKLEVSLGGAMPQMEVRFRNLSISIDHAAVVDESSTSPEAKLPTLSNVVKHAFVAATTKHHGRKDVLQNLSGSFKPGTMTLILGQPGSGKSSLMKVLSGRFPTAKDIAIEGSITYNGVPQQEIRRTLPQFAAYVDQRDKHFPTLTVQETLAFAHTVCGGELSRRGEELLSKGTLEENVEALAAANAIFAHYSDVIVQQLGLQSCKDTVVGDAMLRGVSGGERKRVTTGEMEFGMKYAAFMDEISTGLDSATTFDIVNTQRSIATKLRKTVVIALLQPSPEVFALFDDVMLLNAGQVMYHGPRKRVLGYFASLGFACPPERDTADFLLDLGTKQQLQYETQSSVSQQPARPRSASEFAAIFRGSAIHTETLRALDEPLGPELLASVSQHMERMPEFHQSFWANVATLSRRQLTLQLRDTSFLVNRALMVVVVTVVNALTFYQFNPRDVQVVIGITYGSVLFLALGQSTQLPGFFAARDVFYKQRRANFVRTPAFVLANSAAQAPLAVAETLVFGTLVYWMCGYAVGAAEFLTFQLVLFLTSMVFGAWFFFLATICPDNTIATPFSLLSAVTPILFSGFVVVKSSIPGFLVWIYWLTPLSWGIRALAVSQYRSSAFDVCEYQGIDYCAEHGGRTMGEYYLSLFDLATERYWILLAVVAMVAMYALVVLLSCLALEYKRYESPASVAASSSRQQETTVVAKAADAGDNYALASTPKSSRSSSAVGSPPSTAVAVDVQPTHEAPSCTPVTLAFRDLWYSVPLPGGSKRETIDLLKGISGYALPGTITALMGSSGAGKTTLMDVIAGRKTGGKARGTIFLNGYEATDLAIRRATGYCEQMDIHLDASTIREALTFSAFLRQDASVSASAKYASVDECLDLLDLHGVADEIVRGRSVEQMKRLTIGVELAAQPSVLFLDEPTSGLDARSAKLIMDGVRKVADTGRTVVCTIHQPSSEVFFLFDSLLLLKRGGEMVFFGDLGKNCRNLVNYFESIPGVAPLPVDCNPATWMLECIGAGVENVSAAVDADFAALFSSSTAKRELDAALATPGTTTPAPHVAQLVFAHKRAASSATQMRFVIGRFVDSYWRNPSYNLTRVVMAISLGLLFGLEFSGADLTTYQGLSSAMGMLFLMTVFRGHVAFASVIPVAMSERASFYRERYSQTYNVLWYFVGSSLVEIPYVFANGALFTAIFYPLAGFSSVAIAVLFWLNLSLVLLMQTYVGQLFAFAMPSEEVAGILGVTVTNILILFMGYSPPANAIPSSYKWLYHLTPQRFSLSISAALLLSDCSTEPVYDAATNSWSNVGPEIGCQPVANTPPSVGHVTVKQFMEQVFGVRRDTIGTYFVVMIGFIAGLRVLHALALRYVNHQKR